MLERERAKVHVGVLFRGLYVASRFLRRKPFTYNGSEHKLSLNVKQNGFGIQPYMHEILANMN